MLTIKNYTPIHSRIVCPFLSSPQAVLGPIFLRFAKVRFAAQLAQWNPKSAVGTTKHTKATKWEGVAASSRFIQQVSVFGAEKTQLPPLFSCLSCLSWFISTAVFSLKTESNLPDQNNPHTTHDLPH